MLKKLLLPVLFVAFFVQMAAAQTGTIRGTVTNQEGEPVPTANVLLVEINRGTATNLQGQYVIQNVPAGTYTLRVTFVGYADYTDQVTIEAGQTLNKDVVLQRATVGLEELVVTGFGTQSKIEFSGSVAQVEVGKEIENVPVVNVTTALQGSVTGLQIAASTGTPGEGADINIRGVSSINAGGQPLFVIDGVPVLTGNISDGDATSNIGLLSTINPQSIASVTVLKGPVATAQYGARGSNGVIVITTKRGTAGETQYSFSLQRGTVSLAVDGPESLTASEAAELYRDARNLPADADIPVWDGQTNTNWKEIVMKESATTQSYQLSASGGTEQATFYGSLSFQKKESIVIGSQFKRFGGNLNFTYDFNDAISISNQFTGSYSNQKGFLEGDAFFGNPILTRWFYPSFYPAYNEDGTANLTDPPVIFNPVYTIPRDITDTKTYRVINSTKLDIDITDNLVFHSEVGLDYAVNEEKLYRNPVYGDGADLGGTSEAIYTRVFQGTIQNGLEYFWTINENHTLELRIGQTAQLYKNYRIYSYASGFASLGLTNVISGAVPRAAESSLIDGSILSFLGKAHYSYKDKIFIDAVIRQEGNSIFSEKYRWGTFYGIGAGWLLSSEDFLANSDFIDLLKIRASYGLTGNDNIDRNQYQQLLSFSSTYNDIPGIIPEQLGNFQLTWEKARKINIGLTFGLFNRIDGDVTLFYSNSYDLLYEIPLSRTTGFDEQVTNTGELINKGIEVALDIDVIRTEEFLLSLSGNFTYLQNEVTDLPTGVTGETLTIIDPNFRYTAVVGYPVNSWYMKTYAGVNPENGNPLWELNDDDDNPGEVTSNWGDAEPEYQGASGTPTHYGSIGLTVNYKGFYAGASLYGSFGAKVYDIWGGFLASDGNRNLLFFGAYAEQLDRWQEPGDITDVPERVVGGNNNSFLTSTRYLYDADYLRLQTLRVGYNVPVSLLNQLNIGLRGLNVYLLARNIWTYTFSDELEHDPETGDLGRLDLQGPTQQSITFGINIQF